MMHSPCGADNPGNVCMRGNECSKNFPKDFRDLTDVNVQGYPKYRRMQDGRTVEKRVPGRNEPVLLDNQFVIPYNPYLSQKFNCHINVEACMSIASVKYLYKYIYKGHDRADVLIHEVWHYLEILHYTNTRYVYPGEDNDDDNDLPKYQDRQGFRLENIAKEPNPAGNPSRLTTGEMENDGQHCHALLFPGDNLSLCCMNKNV